MNEETTKNEKESIPYLGPNYKEKHWYEKYFWEIIKLKD